MARHYCQRCGEECNTLNDAGHLCTDIKRRVKRREAQVEAVMSILYDPQGVRGLTMREKAEAIVKKLSQMGVTD